MQDSAVVPPIAHDVPSSETTSCCELALAGGFDIFEVVWSVQTKGGRTQGWWQIFLLAFSNTLREGLESVVFLTGVSAGTDPRSIPLAGIVGIILGILVGVALYYTYVPSIPEVAQAGPGRS